MQAYRVGGSVRDELLGLPVVDRDWVVVGATPEEMIARGFKPVGKDFPVFLHPETREEYALARTERKTGPGYRGFEVHFAPGVTLEEDLARRDLTINAIAKADNGALTDPFDGRRDLRNRVLRHVSESFAEDPVRILRVARFAARFADFTVAPETMALMQRMTATGEVDALVPERVWQELSRGLQETRPSSMMETLRQAGALQVLLPELAAPGGPDLGDPGWTDWLGALDRCAGRRESLPVCYAVFANRAQLSDDSHDSHNSDAAVLQVSRRLRAPSECRELATLLAGATLESRVAAQPGFLEAAATSDAARLLEILERCDAWRRPERLAALTHAAAALTGADPEADAGAARLRKALQAANSVDQAAIAAGLEGPRIRDAIRRERLGRIAAAVGEDVAS
jgi:tRNA nucleotidyltransferase (CCA-adding enzyme)